MNIDPPLIPPEVVVVLILAIIAMKIYHFIRYKDWFVLSLSVPLSYTLFIYMDEVINHTGKLTQPVGRLSTILLLLVIGAHRVFDLYRLHLKGAHGTK